MMNWHLEYKRILNIQQFKKSNYKICRRHDQLFHRREHNNNKNKKCIKGNKTITEIQIKTTMRYHCYVSEGVK